MQGLSPFLGMQINTSEAGVRTGVYRGHTYYFCSQRCKEKFDRLQTSRSRRMQDGPEQRP